MCQYLDDSRALDLNNDSNDSYFFGPVIFGSFASTIPSRKSPKLPEKPRYVGTMLNLEICKPPIY